MQQQVIPETVYATFAGMIDNQSLARIFQSFAAASQGGAKEVHLLFQSTGGTIADGLSLYRYFDALPLTLHIYNTGSVQSVAVLAYLGATFRHTSASGNFMIHKTHTSPQAGANAAKLGAHIDSLLSDDARVEAILKAETSIPDEKWTLHAVQDVVFSAQEAVAFGIADDICEFRIPDGNKIYNI
jgi:ATP-dependent Clp protease, protease subunit